MFVCGRFGVFAFRGSWVFVSLRSGRVLSGGAAAACRRAWLRRLSASSAPVALPVPVLRAVRLLLLCRFGAPVGSAFGVSGSGVPACFLPVLPAWSRSPLGRDLAVASFLFGSLRGFGVGPLARGCSFAPRRAWRVARVRRPRPAPVVAAGGVVPSSVPRSAVAPASSCGSRLWLSSPAFLAAVRAGACPVSLCLRVFRWPVRSALLGALAVGFLSRRVREVLCSAAFRPVLVSFVRSALAALGFSVSGRWLSRAPAAASFLSRVASGSWGCFPPELFRAVRVSGGFSSSALFAAFRALSRCLSWLASRSAVGRGCPPALRGGLAVVAWFALSCVGSVLPASFRG